MLEYAGAFLQLYREEGWYLERTVHYVAPRRPRPRQEEGRSRTRDGRKALWERLQFALDGEPDPWHELERARIDTRQFILMRFRVGREASHRSAAAIE